LIGTKSQFCDDLLQNWGFRYFVGVAATAAGKLVRA
jgi:hypothetical protein